MHKLSAARFTAAILLLAVSLAAVLSACAGNDSGSTPLAAVDTPDTDGGSGAKTVTIGVTYAPSDINPLEPAGLVSTYIDSLMFPPLVELDSDLKFKPMLADSIETTDNRTFTIRLNPNAKWTDGSPVTADDVIFTLNLMTNAKVASSKAYPPAILDGLDESGFMPEGRTRIEGVRKLNGHTLAMKTKEPTTLRVFNDRIGRTLMTLPQAALKDIPPEDVNKSAFARKPNVTDGPFKLAEIDPDRFVRMEANEDYFRGAPKLDELNFKVLQGTDIAAQLKSGAVDLNIPSAGVIPVADYDKVKGLRNVSAVAGPPLATQFMYINEKVVPDAKQRQAISYALDRERIVNELLKGAGEATDGFFTSYSPYRDNGLKPVPYDPMQAKRMLKESGWDSSKKLTLSVLSGDSTLEQAAAILTDNLKAAGLKVKLQMTDLATLLDKLVKQDYDLSILPETLSPVNPLSDITYYLHEGNPVGYRNEEAEKLLTALCSEVDETKIKDDYAQLQRIAAEDVPMPSIYATRALGAVNRRVIGAAPKDFGMFINVNQWDVR